MQFQNVMTIIHGPEGHKRNYGKLSLILSIVSWLNFIIFTLASVATFVNAYEGHMPGMPRPEETWMETIFAVIAFLSYPMSALAVLFAIFSLYRQRNMITGIIGGLIGVVLFLFLSLALVM